MLGMFTRALCSSGLRLHAVRNSPSSNIIAQQYNFSSVSLTKNNSNVLSPLLSNPKILQISSVISRSVTKYSLTKGKRKSVKAVLTRFYRLNWGGWVRTICGRQKKLWKKSIRRKYRIRQHVLCNATQSTLLDKMVGSYWRKPKYYVDDPYEPYHSREEFMYTYKKPRPYIPK